MTTMTQNNCSNLCSTSARIKTKKPSNLFSTLLIWRARHKSRQQLAALEPHILKDIGISAEEARLESLKPFWCTI